MDMLKRIDCESSEYRKQSMMWIEIKGKHRTGTVCTLDLHYKSEMQVVYILRKRYPVDIQRKKIKIHVKNIYEGIERYICIRLVQQSYVNISQ